MSGGPSAQTSSTPLDIEGLAALYKDLLAAVTATIDPGASKDAPAETAKRLGTLREEFFAKCNDLIDELVALQQQVAVQPAHTFQQQQQQAVPAAPPSSAAQPDDMDVDGQQHGQQELQQHAKQLTSALAQQHRDFLQHLHPAVPAAGGGPVS